MRIFRHFAILISFYSDFCQANHQSDHPKVNIRIFVYSNTLNEQLSCEEKSTNILTLLQPNAYKAAEEIKQATLPQQRKEREVVILLRFFIQIS